MQVYIVTHPSMPVGSAFLCSAETEIDARACLVRASLDLSALDDATLPGAEVMDRSRARGVDYVLHLLQAEHTD